MVDRRLVALEHSALLSVVVVVVVAVVVAAVAEVAVDMH